MSDLKRLDLSQVHPSLSRGQVWCRTCGATIKGVNGMRDGWPKCCGYTMTIDSPSERRALLENHHG